MTGGAVQTGAGTLTVNGDISLGHTARYGGFRGRRQRRIAPTISGNVSFAGSVQRQITVRTTRRCNRMPTSRRPSATRAARPISAPRAPVRSRLGGNNSGLTGSFFVGNTPGANQNNQPSVFIGNANALGTGTVFPLSGTALAGDGGALTIANRVMTQGFNYAGGNDLTLSNSVDLLSNATINVQGAEQC